MNSTTNHLFENITPDISMQRVTNIMLLAIGLHDLAHAFKTSGSQNTKSIERAVELVEHVKYNVVWTDGRPISESDLHRRTEQDWDQLHAFYLAQAEDIFHSFDLDKQTHLPPDVEVICSKLKDEITKGRYLEIQ